MRELFEPENHFLWDEEVLSQSFKRVKQLISECPVLKYFDPKFDTELQCDALEKGLGVCFMQNGQPVGYASRQMTSAETNHVHMSKEFLVIVFGVSNSMFMKDTKLNQTTSL